MNFMYHVSFNPETLRLKNETLVVVILVGGRRKER